MRFCNQAVSYPGDWKWEVLEMRLLKPIWLRLQTTFRMICLRLNNSTDEDSETELWSSNPQLYFGDGDDQKDCGRNSPRRLSLMRSPRTEEILKSVEQALHKTDKVFQLWCDSFAILIFKIPDLGLLDFSIGLETKSCRIS